MLQRNYQKIQILLFIKLNINFFNILINPKTKNLTNMVHRFRFFQEMINKIQNHANVYAKLDLCDYGERNALCAFLCFDGHGRRYSSLANYDR